MVDARYVANLAVALSKLRKAVDAKEGVTLNADETWATAEALKSLAKEVKR